MEDIKKKYKLNLQFFAEQSDDGSNADNKDKETSNNDNNQEQADDPEKKFTQEEVNKMIKERVAREQKKADEKAKEAEKLAMMNKDQKAEYEREKLEKEVKELRAEKNLNEMRSEARKMLVSNEVDSTDDVVNLVVSETAEQTKENVEAFTKIIKKAVTNALKQHARQNIPTGSDGFTHTKSESNKNLAQIAKEKRIIKN
ncbi:DUF4355 domain-containing protein [Mammaliicoccus sciuri]|uniref:DUF4355 domain-containing protein n=1 Tax=Mammaliicoccus sciuri TaxID=1296 RepID=UPI00379F1CA0